MTTETVLLMLLTAGVTHLLTKSRDVQSRKAILNREAEIRRRHFEKYILQCRYWLERIDPKEGELVWRKYSEIAPLMLAEAELVESDYFDAEEFKRLVDRAGHWERQQAEKEAKSKNLDLRDILRDSIKAVYDFTKGSIRG